MYAGRYDTWVGKALIVVPCIRIHTRHINKPFHRSCPLRLSPASATTADPILSDLHDACTEGCMNTAWSLFGRTPTLGCSIWKTCVQTVSQHFVSAQHVGDISPLH